MVPYAQSRHQETHETVSEILPNTNTAPRAGTHRHLEKQRAQEWGLELVPPSTCALAAVSNELWHLKVAATEVLVEVLPLSQLALVLQI